MDRKIYDWKWPQMLVRTGIKRVIGKEIVMNKTLIPQIKKILYATDLSRNSTYAFAYAVELAKICGAKIVMMHTFEPLRSLVRYHSTLKEEEEYYLTVKEQTSNELRARVDLFCQKVDAQFGGSCSELIADLLFPTGSPAEEILASADEKECDMIVMGTRGKDSLKDAFVGSTAQIVLQKTRKPVLVVPLPAEQESVLEGKTILVVDDEPDVREVIKEEILGAVPDCAVVTCGSYEEAANLLTSQSYDLAILDIMGVRGFDLLEIAVKRPHPIPVVILTAQAHSPESLRRSIEMGARAYLPKQQLGEIVRHLEDIMTYEYGPAWRRLLKEIEGYLNKGWGPYWRQPDEIFWKEFDKKIDSEE
jgi:nucleotide-binding universal stress UspA family protein/CheY-like chemotaxis protein